MPEHPAAPRTLRISPLGCLVAFFAILFLVPAVAIWTYRARNTARVEKLLAEARSRGEPTTPAELEEYYALDPGAANPATIWLAAVNTLDGPEHVAAAGNLPGVGTGQGDVPLPGQPWPLEEEAQEYLARYATHLEKMHQAATIGGPGRYPTEFNEGLAMQLNHVQALRAGVRLLNLEARMAARRGDTRAAARSIHAIFMAAESLEREPILISQLVRCAFMGIGTHAVEDLLPAVEFAEDDLKLLEQDLVRADFKDGVQRGLLGERVIGTASVRAGNSIDLEGYAGGAAITHGLPYYLESMQKFNTAVQKPWPQAIQEAAAQEQAIQTQSSTPLGRLEGMTAAMLAPALGAAMEAGARTEAQSRVTATAIAIERFRRRNGRPPEKLDQLVPDFLPALPKDPFDGASLRYVTAKEGYLLWSIGRDRKNDGGAEKDQSGDPDVVFQFPAPER